jgi:LacI family transcriptional regulator
MSVSVFVLLSPHVEEHALYDGVRLYATNHGLDWQVTACFPRGPYYWRQEFDGAQPPAVLIGRTRETDVIDDARQRDMLWVEWLREGSSARGDAAVEIDSNAIGRQAAEYLVAQGMRSFAVQALARDAEFVSRSSRYQAFFAALASRGATCHTVLSQHLGIDRDLQNLRDFARSVPQRIGFFLYTDEVAEWLLTTLNRAGIDVPGQAAVLGCGNRTEAEYTTPALSSIRLPYRALGYAAAGQAHRLISGERPERRLIPPVGVAERESTVVARHSSDDTLNRALRRSARADRPIPSVTELARHCRISRSSLCRCFQRHLGQSPKAWLRERALQRANTMLLETDRPLLEIARQCGWKHDTYFINAFQERFGITPGRYRKLGRGA